jgi:hypothetical protein
MLFFGALGSAMMGVGLLLWAWLGSLWFFADHTQRRPVMYVAGIAMLAGLLVILVGFLAELVVNATERIQRLERRLDAIQIGPSERAALDGSRPPAAADVPRPVQPAVRSGQAER